MASDDQFEKRQINVSDAIETNDDQRITSPWLYQTEITEAQ